MHKLRRKMFWTLFLVLCVLAGFLTFFMNYRLYLDAVGNLQQQLIQVSSFIDRLGSVNSMPWMYRDKESKWEEEEEDDEEKKPQIFLVNENPVYMILLNRNRTIQAISYYNTDGQDLEGPLEAGEKIAAHQEPGEMKAGNLFHSAYVWYYGSPSTITLIDIQTVRQELLQIAGLSLLLLAGEILLIWWVCRKLTSWMIAPIEQTFEKQKQFIADASHELKTPLAVIMANAEVLEQDPNPKWLKNIQDEADRMNALIKSLLDLTRSEQETITLSPVNLSFLVEKEISIQEAMMFEKGIETRSDILPHVEVLGQSSMLEKVLEILLENAACHAEKIIDVSLQVKGGYALLKIGNDGDKIPVQEREKIFERFYRSDASRHRQENRYGLGLAIARNLMERMGGTIGVGEQNEQTTFWIRLKTI